MEKLKRLIKSERSFF